MLRNTVYMVALIYFCLSQSAYAQSDSGTGRCSETIVNLVGNYFEISDFSYDRSSENKIRGGVIIAGVCKTWPKNNEITIAIFAYDSVLSSDDEYGKPLIVALVDNAKGRVIATYKGTIQEDAAMTVGEYSLKIDTARYDIAPGIRAFGLDVTTGFSQGCVDGGFGSVRTLFIQDGKEIRPILEGLYMSYWSFVKGGPSCVSGDGEIVTEDISISIGIGGSTSKGYSNLLITAVSNGAKIKRNPFHYELHYDGIKYPIDGMQKEFWKWRM